MCYRLSAFQFSESDDLPLHLAETGFTPPCRESNRPHLLIAHDLWVAIALFTRPDTTTTAAVCILSSETASLGDFLIFKYIKSLSSLRFPGRKVINFKRKSLRIAHRVLLCPSLRLFVRGFLMYFRVLTTSHGPSTFDGHGDHNYPPL